MSTRRLRRRPATHADYDFLHVLHKRAMGPYVEQTWGWDEGFQVGLFRQGWEAPANQVVLLGEERIGVSRVEDHGDHLSLDQISLLPEHQREGFGSALIGDVQQMAEARGVPSG